MNYDFIGMEEALEIILSLKKKWTKKATINLLFQSIFCLLIMKTYLYFNGIYSTRLNTNLPLPNGAGNGSNEISPSPTKGK